MRPESYAAWPTWFGAWFAAHWSAADLPSLRIVILVYDLVLRGNSERLSELRLWLDTFRISPKGQQDRRWLRPSDTPPEVRPEISPDRYAHLRAVEMPDD